MPSERDNARNNARCMQANKATHGLDGGHGTTSRCGQESPWSVEESFRIKEDRDKWRQYVHGVANLRLEDG